MNAAVIWQRKIIWELTVKTKITSSLSVFLISIMLSACGGSGSSSSSEPQEKNQDTADTTAPVISIVGSTEVQHEQGTDYVDSGASASDTVDGDVEVTVDGSVDDAAGVYTITYHAKDAAGNEASATRTVTVKDTLAPQITLNGEQSYSINQGEQFNEPGASAVDLVDGDVSVQITGSVAADIGTYTLTYSATDSVGNTAQVSRTVSVVGAAEESDLMVFSDGVVNSIWDRGINAFDEAIGWGECSNDQGAGCPSIAWQIVNDSERENVLQVTHANSDTLAGLFIAIDGTIDLSAYSNGSVSFDIKVVSGDSNITMKLDCLYPCSSGDQPIGSKGSAGWETVEVSMATLTGAGLDIKQVNTGIVIWASQAKNTVFLLDNIRFTGITEGEEPPEEGNGSNPPNVEYNITAYGAGSVSDTINPASYRCVYDYGNWIYNAGVVEPGISGCDTATGTPVGQPTKMAPQLTGSAVNKPVPTHKWWGSIPFMGEMTIGDPNKASYITPDPMIARVSNRGIRIMGIGNGLSAHSTGFGYTIPDPFSEVFDGIAIANSDYSDLDAFLKDHSDGSVTVQWQSGATAVMDATLVHGSPYVYFNVYEGEAIIKTKAVDSGEKGIFYNQDNTLGVWTSVAGNHNNFLITGDADTSFTNADGDAITISNDANAFTLTYLPDVDASVSSSMIEYFNQYARNVVAKVAIDYSVDRSDNQVTVTHKYLDTAGENIDTIIGLHPLHWKHSEQTTSSYKIRSARGVIKFAQSDSFDYTLPFLGVLPSLPSIDDTFDKSTLEQLVRDFTSTDSSQWNTHTDAYWSGKNYGKVAELIAIADSIDMQTEATALRDWLKQELSDWFSAETNDSLDEVKYFVYDEQWTTLLALEESFASHQQLNDHHFHYGYMIRAAAEICRTDANWCSAEQYGPMIELLIRDYAGGKDDDMFPYLRNFDPANGFSWASGNMNFARGNNNESTSEAANAYGAIVLYGLITGNDTLTERGMYLHASTAASYWQYWNNIDGYRNTGSDDNNFPAGFDKITTSIIWGEGSAFSTWFSGAYAHILGIQGLPINPLILHVGLHADYMQDYVELGLTESSNGKPSGLIEDQWRDIWWNLWAMTDADAAITDYKSMSNYNTEAGESKAHTYHWIYTLQELGQLTSDANAITANYPSAIAFSNDGVITYVVYNYGDTSVTVTFSDGKEVIAAANSFTLVN